MKIKRNIILILIFLIVIICNTKVVFAENESSIDIAFKDTNLYNEIVSTLVDVILEKNDETKTIKINQTEIDKIEFMNLSNKSIIDLSGIENFTNLLVLNLNSNHISNIQPIEKLTRLEKLQLYDNNISSIESLEKLTNLKQLCLTGNDITDISSLSELKNLNELYLSEYYIGSTSIGSGQGGGTSKTNKIKDISPLSNLENLKYLYLSGLEIDTIEHLKSLIELKTLLIGNTLIEDNDLEPLKYLKNLDRLDLSNNGISDISVLEELTNLTIIDLENNNISDISALRNFEKLTWLYLNNNKIGDISLLNQIKIRDVRVNEQKIELEVNSNSIELPKLLLQARDTNSVGYTENEFIFLNCSLSQDGTKLILDEGATVAKVSIRDAINDWSLAGSEITIRLKANENPEEEDNTPIEDNTQTGEDNTQIEEDNTQIEEDNPPKEADTTISKTPIPNTGKSVAQIIILTILLITCIVLFIKNKEMKDLK